MYSRVSLFPFLDSEASFVMTARVRAVLLVSMLTVGLIALPSPAHAQGFVGGLIGYNFGGNADCPTLRNCETKHRNLGVTVGSLGKGGGAEFEVSDASELLVSTGADSSSVRSFMSNGLVGPKLGPVQPFGLFGVGMLRMHTEFTTPVSTHTENKFAWDAGFGVIVFLGHVGIRGDIRHFSAFGDSDYLKSLTGDDAKLDYGRASGSILIKF